MTKGKFGRPPLLTHEEKRQIAKEVVSGKLYKNILVDWGISYTYLYTIVKGYVITTMVEKYPDKNYQEDKS